MSSWVTIKTFTYPHEAHFAKSYLESEGIDVIIRDEQTIQINNFFSNAIGGVKLQVKDTDLERSKIVLLEGGYYKPEDVQPKEKIQTFPIRDIHEKEYCPFCNSKNIGKKRQPSVFMMILFFLLGALFPIFQYTFICYDCDKEFKFKRVSS